MMIDEAGAFQADGQGGSMGMILGKRERSACRRRAKPSPQPTRWQVTVSSRWQSPTVPKWICT